MCFEIISFGWFWGYVNEKDCAMLLDCLFFLSDLFYLTVTLTLNSYAIPYTQLYSGVSLLIDGAYYS